MTHIDEILQRAADVPIPVDAESDLRRGRAYARSARRRLATFTAVGVVGVAAAVGLGYAALPDRDGSRAVDDQGFAGQPSKATHHRPTKQKPQHHAPAVKPRPIHAKAVAPATLVHTQYFEVPPTPAGWHLVGATPFYVMIAPDGTTPPLEGGFEGKLMVLLESGFDPSTLPDETPYAYDGRTFWFQHDDLGSILRVKAADGDLVTVQWPDSAHFELADMVAYLDAVRPLPGSMSAS